MTLQGEQILAIERRQQPWRLFQTCCRCNHLTSDLKLLPCIHGCCSACLDQLRHAAASTTTGIISCPACRQCARGHLRDSPANRYVAMFAPSIASRNVRLATSWCSWGHHQISNGDRVVQYCHRCRREFCSGCAMEHSRMQCAASHPLVPIEDMLPLEAETSCKDHSGKQILIYCVNCRKTGCLKCCLGSHRQHLDCQDVTDLAEECRRKISEDVERLRSEIYCYEDKLHQLDGSKNDIKDTVDALKRSIQSQYDAWLYQINVARKSLNGIAETFKEQTLSHLELLKAAITRQLAITRSVEQFSEKVREVGDDCQVVCFYMNLSKEAWTWPQEVLQMASPKKIIFSPIDITHLVPEDKCCLFGEVIDEDQQMDRLVTWNEMKTQLGKMTRECQQLIRTKTELEQNVLQLVDSNRKYEEKVKENQKIIMEQKESINASKKLIQENEQKLNTLVAERTAAQNRISVLENEVASLMRGIKDLEDQKNVMERNLIQQSEIARNEKELFDRSLIELTECRGQMELLRCENERLQFDVQMADRERRDVARWNQMPSERFTPTLVPVAQIPDTNVRGLAPVYGVTTLNYKLYVLRMGSCYLEIYGTDTFLLLSKVLINGLAEAIDMTSCEMHWCIYIADGRNNMVHSIKQTESSTGVGCHVVTKWTKIVHGPRGLSVTPAERHLLVACATETNQLVIFSADGQQLKTISLNVGGGIRHAIQLPCGQLLVCFIASRGPPAYVGGVCHVTRDGVVRREIFLDTPYHLAVDSFYNDVYVANFEERKVMLLHRDLTGMSEPIEDDGRSDQLHDIRQPLRLCLDQINRRLYVAECGGRVTVYAVNEARTVNV